MARVSACGNGRKGDVIERYRKILCAFVAMALVAGVSTGSAGAAGPRGPGDLASGFGEAGVLRLGQYPAGRSVSAMRTDSLGRIYLLERNFVCGTPCESSAGVRRLLPDGRPDPTYAGGLDYRPVSPPVAAFASQTVFTVDNAGDATVVSISDQKISVLKLDGTGTVIEPVAATYSCTECLLGEPIAMRAGDGSVVIEADLQTSNGEKNGAQSWSPPIALLMRQTADGALDRSFGKSGFAKVGGLGILKTAEVQPDGAILLAPWGQRGSDPLVRVAADGRRVDRRLGRHLIGTDGVRHIPSMPTITSIAPAKNGKILVSANVAGARSRSFLARIGPRGGLDRSYGAGGKIRFREVGTPMMLVDAGGRAVVVNGGERLSVHRRLPNGRPDPSWPVTRIPPFEGDDPAIMDMAFSGKRPLLANSGGIACRSACGSQPSLIAYRGGPG